MTFPFPWWRNDHAHEENMENNNWGHQGHTSDRGYNTAYLAMTHGYYFCTLDSVMFGRLLLTIKMLSPQKVNFLSRLRSGIQLTHYNDKRRHAQFRYRHHFSLNDFKPDSFHPHVVSLYRYILGKSCLWSFCFSLWYSFDLYSANTSSYINTSFCICLIMWYLAEQSTNVLPFSIDVAFIFSDQEIM